jgi:hypothetical protein
VSPSPHTFEDALIVFHLVNAIYNLIFVGQEGPNQTDGLGMCDITISPSSDLIAIVYDRQHSMYLVSSIDNDHAGICLGMPSQNRVRAIEVIEPILILLG